jgi:cytochrome c oxidase subunit II
MSDTITLNYLAIGIIIMILLIVGALISMLDLVLRLNDKKGLSINWQRLNSILFPVFLVAGFGAIIYQTMIHSKYLLPESASAHGVSIDMMTDVTLIITGVVFVITHILLFVFAYMYRQKKNKKGFYYPDNNKLEVFWTAVPAVVLTIMVLFGFLTWKDVTYAKETDKDLPQIEVVGEQFNWIARYPGEGGKLGKIDYTLFKHNSLGLDFNDEDARNDILSYELVLPVNQEVMMNFRAKDVLHSAYLPHFRVQMYTVPGMPTSFRFTPTITTEAMRERMGNPDFNYELACNQICGVAHYNMRMVVKIVEEDEYKAWLAEQQPYFNRYKDNFEITELN